MTHKVLLSLTKRTFKSSENQKSPFPETTITKFLNFQEFPGEKKKQKQKYPGSVRTLPFSHCKCWYVTEPVFFLP